jgi:hypothetical protein
MTMTATYIIHIQVMFYDDAQQFCIKSLMLFVKLDVDDGENSNNVYSTHGNWASYDDALLVCIKV